MYFLLIAKLLQIGHLLLLPLVMALSKFPSDHSIKLICEDKAQKEFVDGLQSLDKAVQILCNAEINATTPASTVKVIAERLRCPISKAHKHLTKALVSWEGETSSRCENIEELVSIIHDVKSVKSEQEMIIESLNQQIQGKKELIKDLEKIDEQAKSSQARAKDTHRDAEKKLRGRRRTRNVAAGIGIIAVPIFGWIAGASIGAVCCTTLENGVKSAKAAVRSAEADVKDCENWLQKNMDEKKYLCQHVNSEESEKQKTEQLKIDLEYLLQDLQMALQRSVNICDKLMKTCHAMRNIWGKF